MATLGYEDDFHQIVVKMDGKEKSIPNPLTFYHKALMRYNPKLELEIIVLFEKLLVFYRTNKLKPFQYQQDRLSDELHIKRTRLAKARKYLTDHKILQEYNPGKGMKIRYTLNKENIIAMLPELYRISKEDTMNAHNIDNLKTFFIYYLDKRYLRVKNDQSIPDNIHIGNFDITGLHKIGEDTGNKSENNQD